jgi:hypothetical protein
MKTHMDVIAWQKSIDLLTEIYAITKVFRKNKFMEFNL